MPQKFHSLASGVVIFECECRHLLRPAPVHNVHISCAKPDGSNRCIDGRIPCSYNDDARRHRRSLTRLVSSDEVQRIRHSGKLFSSDPKPMNRPETNPQKDGIVLSLKFGERGRIDHLVKMKINTQLREHLNLT